MEFSLKVDLDKMSGNQAHELARVLRYWAGSLQDGDLAAGQSMNIYDSSYHRVGKWKVSGPKDEQPAAEDSSAEPAEADSAGDAEVEPVATDPEPGAASVTLGEPDSPSGSPS